MYICSLQTKEKKFLRESETFQELAAEKAEKQKSDTNECKVVFLFNIKLVLFSYKFFINLISK